ncbi:hypothetical protein PanWU01x14_201990 [Parasponia andersonii]|uniref:Uncharacterized protein n=1 Tax=Parasponia andersonii TaxID=3476 RepID=A0A2P5BXJ6_PARAD|nr:hypothetical protein PanWU01x14_201990 [Parasponia andersonii]
MGGRVGGRSGSLHSSFVQQRHDQDGGRTKNEVDRYISEPPEDVVEAIPVTTVASESAFSIGGALLIHLGVL